MAIRLRFFASLIAAPFSVSLAAAEEQTLKFRVIMTEVGGSMMDIAALKGHAMAGQKFGQLPARSTVRGF